MKAFETTGGFNAKPLTQRRRIGGRSSIVGRMLVSITRLRIRRFWFLPRFALHTLRINRQIQRSDGFVVGGLAQQRGLAFWTITIWRDESAMRAFRNGGAHGRSMRHLMRWANEASFVHWTQADATMPTAEMIFARLRDDGKLTKLPHASTAQQAGETAGRAAPKLVGRLTAKTAVKGGT